MKRIITSAVLTLSLLLTFSLQNQTQAQVSIRADLTYQDFYDELSPYGRWMDYPEYGYVWMPSAGSDFRPYSTNGRWVWSDDYEWIWVSDYNWGWATFHYGRWFYDPLYGWMWVPGYEWAPAWVAWRDGGDYYGWAPLRPGININIGFSIGSYNPPIDYWCFAPRRYIASPRIYNYCLPARQNITIIHNTTIINNYNRRTNNVFVTGPRRMDAERYAGRINSYRLRESNSPGGTRLRRNEVSVYRPEVRRDNNRNFAPRSFERYSDNSNGNRNRFNNDNAVGRNGNNLPERRLDNRNIDRRNDDIGQRRNDGPTGDRQRPVFNRDNDRQPGNSNDQTFRRPESGNRRTRPEVFERNNNQPERGQGNPNFERRNNDVPRPGNNERQMERRDNIGRQNDNNTFPQRRERSMGDQPQRQAPQMNREPRQREQPQQPRQFEDRGNQNRERGEQQQPRQFENRGNQNRDRGEQHGGGGRSERRQR